LARKKKRSRLFMTSAAAAVIVATLTVHFWPRPVLIDLAEVRQGTMIVTINEEGRTRVREPYVVSSPVAGELQRVTVLPGDKVVRGKTIVAEMRPANPSVLDVRTREQAHAAVTAAEAALRVARADLNAAIANRDYARSEHERAKTLTEREITSQVVLERARQAWRVSQAKYDTVEAAIAMRQAELSNARARLIGIEDQGLATALTRETQYSASIPLRAPIDGTILKVFHKSETTLPAGEPVLEIGDVEGDLEIVAELLSSDAVQVTRGDRVIVTNWGGPQDLKGVVDRIDPYGYTKYSALGVEEQRVETTIRFDDPLEEQANLGHGYRVEVRVIVWESEDAVTVPSSALFRQALKWAVFVVENGRAQQRAVKIGRNNGLRAQVLDGLIPGDRVILFPPSGLKSGQVVAQRKLQ
jgi:HlyD family secretion protein